MSDMNELDKEIKDVRNVRVYKAGSTVYLQALAGSVKKGELFKRITYNDGSILFKRDGN